MPIAQNYGELRKQIDQLVGKLLDVHRRALEAQEQLRSLAAEVATQPANEPLSSDHARKSAEADRENDRLAAMILPSEQWPC